MQKPPIQRKKSPQKPVFTSTWGAGFSTVTLIGCLLSITCVPLWNPLWISFSVPVHTIVLYTQKHRYHLYLLPHSVDFNMFYSNSVFSFSVVTLSWYRKRFFLMIIRVNTSHGKKNGIIGFIEKTVTS